ncbi:MAG: hypothetical protein KIT31_11705 [Deltaproteobacteria bacterium]|nr:hypothetical protein [Deltaproteobacteria bacterium]
MLAVLSLAAAACSDGFGTGGTPGDFNQVQATPECGVLSQACIGQGLNAPIARGSTVDLIVEYRVAGSSGPPIELASANEAVLRPISATQLAALDEGMSAVLFTGPDREVIDLVHVFVQKPGELRVNRYDAQGDLLGRVQPSSQLLPGDEVLIAVEAYANGQPLLGRYELAYATTDPAAVQILEDPVFGLYRVIARRPGSAKLSFAALGLDVAWDVEVLP